MMRSKVMETGESMLSQELNYGFSVEPLNVNQSRSRLNGLIYIVVNCFAKR